MRSDRHPLRPRSMSAARPILIVTIASVWVVGCTSPAAVSPTGNPREQAAIEATAIIQRAQATALVLQAQAEATVLVSAANEAGVASTPTPASKVSLRGRRTSLSRQLRARAPRGDAHVLRLLDAETATPSVSPLGEPEDEDDSGDGQNAGAVELLDVEIGRESGLILVQFKAPPSRRSQVAAGIGLRR